MYSFLFTSCFSYTRSFLIVSGGGGVSCIATDDSRSGAVAVAGDNQLLVYHRKSSVN